MRQGKDGMVRDKDGWLFDKNSCLSDDDLDIDFENEVVQVRGYAYRKNFLSFSTIERLYNKIKAKNKIKRSKDDED